MKCVFSLMRCPGDAVAELEAAGHDIISIRTVAPGSKDEDVLELARAREKNHTHLRQGFW